MHFEGILNTIIMIHFLCMMNTRCSILLVFIFILQSSYAFNSTWNWSTRVSRDQQFISRIPRTTDRVKTPSCVPSFSSSYSYIAGVDVADLFLVEAVLISTRECCILTVMMSLISPRGCCILSDDIVVL